MCYLYASWFPNSFGSTGWGCPEVVGSRFGGLSADQARVHPRVGSSPCDSGPPPASGPLTRPRGGRFASPKGSQQGKGSGANPPRRLSLAPSETWEQFAELPGAHCLDRGSSGEGHFASPKNPRFWGPAASTATALPRSSRQASGLRRKGPRGLGCSGGLPQSKDQLVRSGFGPEYYEQTILFGVPPETDRGPENRKWSMLRAERDLPRTQEFSDELSWMSAPVP